MPARFKGLNAEERALEKERIDLEKMESIRSRIDSIVTDPETAEKLKPWYSYMCKRPGFHDEYLPTFNRPNVTLVDTQGAGVEQVYETGVVINGERIELDCLIFGTGFETETGGKLRMGFDIIGKGGVSLAEKWKDGMATLHGITVAGFPNLFITPGLNAQAVVTTNVVHMTSEYAQHVAYVASAVRDRGAEAFELTEEAEAEWVRTIIDRRIDMSAFLEACTPGRYNYEGHTEARPIQNAVFGGGAREYFATLQRWRDVGTLPGMELLEKK
jgi:cation diffusion facilitator CzcD-associated flavoprotein CzcO